ncbi:S41 family peptidase [Sporosarcina newyorkensis]|uniref:Carboxyl-terminal processing protease n=1 Tax=Sporosarcina newyorkensis TaxID=759851 RepID=A0A1T4XXN0_9BACL|nr:S41 family peptidase [Sporosarcina newyorkensis]SKA94274.1 carboxyl-terminal processing protease [Sporosarcina newyorkensis]
MKQTVIAAATIIAWLCLAPVSQAATLDEVKEIVELYYYGEKPNNIQKAKNVNEIINQLDEYSVYLTPAEYKDYLNQYASAGTTTQVAATSAPVTNKTNVQSHMMYGNVGYLKIKTFSSHLLEDVNTHWTRLKNQGAEKLILDLRFNGGGYVESAEQLLGFFPKAKEAYKLKTRMGTESAKAIPAKNQFPANTYVLVNRYSASASEIVAVSVKDQEAAVVVGENTKGKGSVQSLFELANGGALKLTTGHYTGPKGTPVQHKGVQPTINMTPGTELTGLHKRLITSDLASKNYKHAKGPTDVPQQKTFNVEFTQPMNFGPAKSYDKMELIKFGSVSIPTTKKQTNNKTMTIQPAKPMQLGAEYMLIVHPGTKSTSGRTVKQGTYTTFKVQTTKKK